MTHASQSELFRRAAEAEGGMPVSAGARISHVRAAISAGRALYVDLSDVPEDARAELVEEIQAVVNRASTRAKDVSKAPGHQQ
jgi:hypothetical protein